MIIVTSNPHLFEDSDLGKSSGGAVIPSFELFLLVLAIYFASSGPAFRMYMRREIPYRCLAIYRPILSIRSPIYPIFRRYMVLWM